MYVSVLTSDSGVVNWPEFSWLPFRFHHFIQFRGVLWEGELYFDCFIICVSILNICWFRPKSMEELTHPIRAPLLGVVTLHHIGSLQFQSIVDGVQRCWNAKVFDIWSAISLCHRNRTVKLFCWMHHETGVCTSRGPVLKSVQTAHLTTHLSNQRSLGAYWCLKWISLWCPLLVVFLSLVLCPR